MNSNYNIWKLFYLIFFIALFLLTLLLYVDFNNIKNRHYSQVENYTDIIAKTINTNFLQKEIILGMFGKQLFKNNSYKNVEETKLILDAIIEQNPYFVALGLADVNGNILIASSNVKDIRKKNLLKDKTTSYDFKRSLSSDTMIVGKTYFFKNIKEWIIPLRKAIKDKNGNTIGIAIAALKNGKNTNYLDSLKLAKNKSIVIIKGFDDKKQLYKMYDSKNTDYGHEELYSKSIPIDQIKKFLLEIKNKYNYSMDDLRKNNGSVSIEIQDLFDNHKISGVKYDKKYNLWILIESDAYELWKDFFNHLLIYTILFILSFIIFYFLFKNIATSEKRKKEELIFEAQHDTLTKLPNRTYMYENIEKWNSKHNEKYDVLYIDLDNFKNINDKFGHSIGDEILKEVAKRLMSFFSKEDMLIRQGGDEFIVLKECLNPHTIEDNFSKLIKLISNVYKVNSKEFRIGMSVGIASYPQDATTIEELLSLADTAMYEAKKQKNSYCFFSEKMRHHNVMKIDIEQELRGAIENNELWMVYQPQINMDGSLYGVEALVRWENKKLGFIGPDKFISVAEESGLMKDLGTFIIQSSLKEIIAIQAELKTIFSLSINISVIQLMEINFLKNILALIKREEFDKSLLTLEITESLSIEDLDEVLPILFAIRDEGIEISLDDFGTGYSSLSVLRELPISELKIDKSFIDKILYDESEKSLVKSIIDIGKNFNMKTLAEGVESEEQVYELKLAKCDIIQGYYYSKPLIKNDLLQYINKKHKG